ncbi:insulinase family protein [Candidatus Poribacteria bacterium]|nr:insulinase family protein [Candidatus Poribacteria bacterium]
MKTLNLKNGLTVMMIPNPAIPLVTLDVWVRVGSKDEPPELAGVSHFLEHMLFKGTERLAVGEYDRRIEEAGGYLNAATSADWTHYYVVLPSEHLDRALVDLADVVTSSKIAPEEVERERHVILEEIRMKEDNPVGFLYDAITRRAFDSGPYANTVIGSRESVSAITRDQLAEHYQRFYAPSNMALVAAGDFDPEALPIRLEELLAGFDRPLRPWRGEVPDTKFAVPATETWNKDWKETYFFVTFPMPVVNTLEDSAIEDVAQTVLLGGRASRLVKELREKQRLVTTISGYFPSGHHPWFVSIHGTCDPAKLDEARAALFAELESIREHGLGAGELRRAKRQLVTDHLYHTETNTGQATTAGYSFALLGNADLLTRYTEAVEAVTEKDAVEFIGRMTREGASMWVARPALEPAGAR